MVCSCGTRKQSRSLITELTPIFLRKKNIFLIMYIKKSNYLLLVARAKTFGKRKKNQLKN